MKTCTDSMQEEKEEKYWLVQPSNLSQHSSPTGLSSSHRRARVCVIFGSRTLGPCRRSPGAWSKPARAGSSPSFPGVSGRVARACAAAARPDCGRVERRRPALAIPSGTRNTSAPNAGPGPTSSLAAGSSPRGAWPWRSAYSAASVASEASSVFWSGARWTDWSAPRSLTTQAPNTHSPASRRFRCDRCIN